MEVYYDIIKLFFFILTFIVSIYQLRLKGILPHTFVDSVGQFVMPVYLVFVGLIIGYIIGYILTQKNESNSEKNYIYGFVIGGFIGVLLSLIYYFILQ